MEKMFVEIGSGTKVCRVCLQQNAEQHLLSDEQLLKKFTDVTQFMIKRNDGLPEYLCRLCVARLNLSYDFKLQSTETEKHLHIFIDMVKTKFNEISPICHPLTTEEQIQALLEAGYQPDTDSYQNVQDQAANRNVISECVVEEESTEILDHSIDEYDHLAESGVDYLDDVYNKDIKPIKNEEIRQFSVANKIAFICSICNKDFSTKSNLMRHSMSHKQQRQYLCSYCGKSFTQKGSLKSHMHRYSGIKRFKCELCERGFQRLAVLTAHMRQHTGEKPFKCNKCPESFRQKQGLKNHVRYKHDGIEPESVPCLYCSKVFQSKFSYTSHLKMKHNDTFDSPLFNCEYCGKIFNLKATLMSHISRLHAGNFMYGCRHCDEHFQRKSDLAKHEMVHLTDKRHECKICGQHFVDHELAMAHAKHHRRQKKHTCHVCKKTFAIEENWLRHMETHTQMEVL